LLTRFFIGAAVWLAPSFVAAQELPCNPCFDPPSVVRPTDDGRHPDAESVSPRTAPRPTVITREDVERLGVVTVGDTLRRLRLEAWTCRGPIRERVGGTDWLVEGCGRGSAIDVLKILPADGADGPLFTVRFTERGHEVASSEPSLEGSAAAAQRALQALSQPEIDALRRKLRAAQ
jgi:hypothetical protein